MFLNFQDTSQEIRVQKQQSASPRLPGRSTLMIGTCISSAWFCVLAPKFLVQPDDMNPLKAAFIVGLGIATPLLIRPFKEIYKTILLRMENMPDKIRPATEELEKYTRDLSEKIGLKRKASINIITNNGQENAHALIDQIYMTDALDRKLSPKEKEFVIGHEISHIRHNDNITGSMSFMALTYGFYNCVASTAVNVKMALSVDFANAVAAGAGTLGVTCIGLQLAALFHKKAIRSMEYRADRSSVEATQDPVSAIAMVTHFGSPDHWYSKLMSTHPERRKRIGRILEDFNRRNPEKTCRLTKDGDVRIYSLKRGTITQSTYDILDATRFDGNSYKIGPCFFERIVPNPDR